MTNKVYRTAQGKIVDLGALQLRNENVRAVGNMSVNARGDLVDSQNRAIDPRTKQVARQYQKQTSNVQNQSTHSSKRKTSAGLEIERPIAHGDKVPDTVPEPQEVATGLAAAIARARQIKQTPENPPKKLSDTEGVRKI